MLIVHKWVAVIIFKKDLDQQFKLKPAISFNIWLTMTITFIIIK